MELSHHLSSILETGTFGTQALSRKTHHCRVTKNCLSVNHFLLVGFSAYMNGRYNGSGSGSLLDPKLSWKIVQFMALFDFPNLGPNCSILKEIIVDSQVQIGALGLTQILWVYSESNLLKLTFEENNDQYFSVICYHLFFSCESKTNVVEFAVLLGSYPFQFPCLFLLQVNGRTRAMSCNGC